jgi:hypothetical protein
MPDPTSTIVQQNQYGFAPQLEEYGEKMLGQAAAVTDFDQNPYMQYMGDRVAQFSPLQQMSYDNAALMQGSGQLKDATATAGQAALGALNTGYTYNPFSAQSFTSGAGPTFDAKGVMTPGTGTAGQYMNPYMQNVTDIQLREAQRQADIASTGRQADQTSKGAFGGSRSAIMDAEAARNLAMQKGDIQAQGLNTAYGQGQQQFNAEQQARQNAAQLNAQQGQYGAGLGLQGLQTALTGASTLGNLGNTQYNQNMGINQMQNQLGAQQQQQIQSGLNNQYQDFQSSQNYPYKQIGFMSDILRGAPTTNAGSTMYNYQAPPSMLSQIGGLGATALGAFGSFGSKANGGMVGSYAKGGLVKSKPQGLVALAIHNMT